jgi:hypothetical protein
VPPKIAVEIKDVFSVGWTREPPALIIIPMTAVAQGPVAGEKHGNKARGGGQ